MLGMDSSYHMINEYELSLKILEISTTWLIASVVSAYLKEQKDYCILCGEIRGPEMRSLTCTNRGNSSGNLHIV